MRLQLGTGGGLAVLGLSIVGYGLLQRGDAAHAKPLAAAQGDPPRQVVWMNQYTIPTATSAPGGSPQQSAMIGVWFFRGWSDGTIEGKFVLKVLTWGEDGSYWSNVMKQSPWEPFPDTQFEMACRTDVNHDGTIDGADLAEILGAWGPANCEPVPDIQCPLNLLSVTGT